MTSVSTLRERFESPQNTQSRSQEWQTFSKTLGTKARVQLDISLPPIDVVGDLTNELDCLKIASVEKPAEKPTSPISPTSRSLKEVRDELIRAAAEAKRIKDQEMELARLERMKIQQEQQRIKEEEERIRQHQLKLKREEEERLEMERRIEMERKMKELQMMEQAKAISQMASKLASPSVKPQPKTWDIVDEPSIDVLKRLEVKQPSKPIVEQPIVQETVFQEAVEDDFAYIPPAKGESPPMPTSDYAESIYPEVPRESEIRIKSPTPIAIVKETVTISPPLQSPRIEVAKSKPPLIKGNSRLAKELNKTLAKLSGEKRIVTPPGPVLHYGDVLEQAKKEEERVRAWLRMRQGNAPALPPRDGKSLPPLPDVRSASSMAWHLTPGSSSASLKRGPMQESRASTTFSYYTDQWEPSNLPAHLVPLVDAMCEILPPTDPKDRVLLARYAELHGDVDKALEGYMRDVERMHPVAKVLSSSRVAMNGGSNGTMTIRVKR